MGDLYKEFRQVTRSLGRFVIGDPVPVFASLEVTLKCNGQCEYCNSPDQSNSSTRELTTQEWFDIIDDLADSGCQVVSLTGGCPLLRDDIVELAACAHQRGLRVRLNTNGRLLEQKKAILQYVSMVTVSLDGVKAVNDRIRGPGAFDAAVVGMQTAMAAGIPVRVTTVLSRDSIAGLDDFLVLAREMGLSVTFQPQYPWRLRSSDVAGLSLPDSDMMKDAMRKIRTAASSGLDVGNSLRALDILERSYVGCFPGMTCFGGRFFVRITAYGGVEVCGLGNDPFAFAGTDGLNLDARDGVIFCMKQMKSPFLCSGCLSSARVEFNSLIGPPGREGRP